MGNGVLYTTLGLEALFLAGGVFILVVSILTRNSVDGPKTTETVAHTILLSDKGALTGELVACSCAFLSCLARRYTRTNVLTKHTASLANAALVLITFLFSIPSFITKTDRIFLKIHAYAVVICAIFTLVIGLNIWFQTLSTGANLKNLWGEQTEEIQSLLQQRFKCCGYKDPSTPPFIPDDVCTNQLVAANLQGCVGPFSAFANTLLSRVFTIDFLIVSIDFALVLSLACLAKDRKEKARYALIDAKAGAAPI